MTQTYGHFVGHDLLTTDVAAAMAFYQGLFPEWSVEAIAMGGGAVYHRIRVAGADQGGVTSLSADAGLTSHWIGSVAVDDCAAAVRRAENSGGQCLVPVVAVPNVGKFALVQDPQGAVIKPFEATRPHQPPSVPTSGQIVWDELLAPNISGSRRFYETVFGWSSVETLIEGTGQFVFFKVGQQDVAGGLSKPVGDLTSAIWYPYFAADDVDARSARATELGATTCVPAREIPGIGRFAVHADPTGAMFALFRFTTHR